MLLTMNEIEKCISYLMRNLHKNVNVFKFLQIETNLKRSMHTF